ncbi:MAG: SBBP repeat-containing protein [Cyanobacteria bacterium J06633_8]
MNGSINKVEWVEQLAGTLADSLFGIATDGAGNSYVTGSFQLGASLGSTTLSTTGINDAFVAKLDSSGNVQWAENFNSTSLESISLSFGIDSDEVGNTYTTGFFTGTVDFGDTSLTSVGLSDVFVTKLDSNGNVIWAEQIGDAGVGLDLGSTISTDNLGNSYVTGIKGAEAETDLSDISADPTSVDGEAFIAKIDSSGNLVWTQNFDSTSFSSGTDIASDAVGNSYVIGTFSDDITLANQTFLSSGDTDIFVTKLDSDGNVEWSQSLGNTLSDTGNGIGLDKAGNIYITGSFEDTVTFGDTTLTSNGERDAFVAKLNNSGNILWAQSFGGTSLDSGAKISVDEQDNIYVTGSFEDTVTFGDTTLTSSSENDSFDSFNVNNGFIVKLDTDGNILSAEQLDYSLLDIAAGNEGNVYGTGGFEDTITIGDTTLTSEGLLDGFVVNLAPVDIDEPDPNPIITTDVDGTTIEAIDLTGFATEQVTVDYTISREADFNNQVYFYAVDDITGTVGGVAVGEDGYMKAALNSLVSPVFSTSDDNTETGSLEFDAGSIVVPVIIADGTLTEALSGEAEVYFPYLGANTDNGNFDHIKLLDDNTFGFEDLPNGGDQDFNDIVIEINRIA